MNNHRQAQSASSKLHSPRSLAGVRQFHILVEITGEMAMPPTVQAAELKTFTFLPTLQPGLDQHWSGGIDQDKLIPMLNTWKAPALTFPAVCGGGLSMIVGVPTSINIHT